MATTLKAGNQPRAAMPLPSLARAARRALIFTTALAFVQFFPLCEPQRKSGFLGPKKASAMEHFAGFGSVDNDQSDKSILGTVYLNKHEKVSGSLFIPDLRIWAGGFNALFKNKPWEKTASFLTFQHREYKYYRKNDFSHFSYTPQHGKKILGVLFFQQEKLTCGDTSVTMATQEDYARVKFEMHSNGFNGGTLAQDLRGELGRLGFSAESAKGNADFLMKNIDEGKPVIILQFIDRSETLHISVITGYEKIGKDLYFFANDPNAGRNTRVHSRELMAQWNNAVLPFWCIPVERTGAKKAGGNFLRAKPYFELPFQVKANYGELSARQNSFDAGASTLLGNKVLVETLSGNILATGKDKARVLQDSQKIRLIVSPKSAFGVLIAERIVPKNPDPAEGAGAPTYTLTLHPASAPLSISSVWFERSPDCWSGAGCTNTKTYGLTAGKSLGRVNAELGFSYSEGKSHQLIPKLPIPIDIRMQGIQAYSSFDLPKQGIRFTLFLDYHDGASAYRDVIFRYGQPMYFNVYDRGQKQTVRLTLSKETRAFGLPAFFSFYYNSEIVSGYSLKLAAP